MERREVFGIGLEDVCALFRQDGAGHVRLVTSAGIYLEIGGRIALLCREGWGVVPIGIGVKDYAELLALKPEAGQAVSCRGGELAFPGGTAWLRLAAVKTEKEMGQPVPAALDALGRELVSLEKRTGLAPLAQALLFGGGGREDWNVYCKAAFPNLAALAEGLERNLPQQAETAAEGLLGLGTGLTPSADDVLCGMVYVLLRSRASEREAVKALAGAVRELAPQRTNAISAAYLTAIAAGGYYERMNDVWRGMRGLAAPRAEGLLEVGSNSGGEMLLGMLAAGRLLCHMEEDNYGRTHCTGPLG